MNIQAIYSVCRTVSITCQSLPRTTMVISNGEFYFTVSIFHVLLLSSEEVRKCPSALFISGILLDIISKNCWG